MRRMLIISAALTLASLAGCGTSIQELQAVDYKPLAANGWEVSTPAEQGLDPLLVAQLYHDADELEKLKSVLVIKDGKLVAEKYFNDGAVDEQALLQSATKSYFSALVGIAFEQGCLTSLDQTMIEFFPEYADKIEDPRKKQITLRHLLQMRSGYPWEESDPALWDALLPGNHLPLLVEYPLVADPGTEFNYSNLTSYLLGVIVSRSCEVDLGEFAEEHLLAPLGVTMGEFWHDDLGYYYSLMHFTARDAARFGQLYLDGGVHEGKQIVPKTWVEASFRRYTEDINLTGGFPANWGLHLDDGGYGYQWWSFTAGGHRIDAARGHGGQQIALIRELDMVVVTTSDPFWLVHNGESWKHELATINLMADFVASLPN